MMPAIPVSTIGALGLGEPIVLADVTTLKHAPAIIQIMPQGFAWNYEAGFRMRRLVDAIALCFGRLDWHGRHLADQVDPHTATLGLLDWERVLKLEPGTLTLAQRRDAVLAKLRARGGQSIPYWKAFLENLGYTNVSIETLEDRFRCGNKIRKRLQSNAWALAIKINATSIPALDDSMKAKVGEAAEATLYVQFNLT